MYGDCFSDPGSLWGAVRVFVMRSSTRSPISAKSISFSHRSSVARFGGWMDAAKVGPGARASERGQSSRVGKQRERGELADEADGLKRDGDDVFGVVTAVGVGGAKGKCRSFGSSACGGLRSG
jgi:hypothetical protein